MKTAIFPGSFDPFTKGHEDIVRRGLKIFDKIVIALGHNTNKTRYFDPEMMVKKINIAFSDTPNVEAIIYDELTAKLAVDYQANYLLRGLRNTTDFEYENTIAQVNSDLNSNLESVFLITSPRFAYISSSVVREVHRYGGDIAQYLPYDV